MPDLSSTDLIQRVRDLLYERSYETTSTTTTTSATVAVTDGTRWEEGAIGEWQTGAVGGEQFYVQSVAANNLTTVRGYAGTTAETHTSGDRVLKNPTYTYRQILQSIQQTVLGLWPVIWKTGSVSLTPVSSTVWYDLNANTRGIVKVTQQASSAGDIGFFGSGTPLIFQQDLPTAVVASGKGLRFPGGLFHSSNTINVTDMRTITGTSDISDSDVLPVAECVVYGAVARLLEALEISRATWGEGSEANISQGERLQAASWYRNEYVIKKQILQNALRDRYQPLRRW